MIKLRIFLSLLFWVIGLSTSSLQAQSKKKHTPSLLPEQIERLKAAEDTLAMIAFLVVNDSIESERFGACRQLITRLVQTLKTPNSFQYPFDRLKSISILTPPDSSFRIFTWQLYVNDSTYRYYGAIQRNSKDLQLFPLIDRSDSLDYKPLRETLTPDRWYGALYYTIRQFDTKQGRKYLLIGYDAFEFFEKRKLIEVLYFDENGQPKFGAPVFQKENTPRGGPEYRQIYQYAAESSVRCNWDELYQMVLVDHLIPIPSPYGRGFMGVPDGSYEGFKLEKGQWKFIEKVFNDFQEEPPSIERTVEKDKDIFGKTKKKKQ